MPIPGETLACWIIPAYAGSTSISMGPGGGWQDHPRIRGEHRATLYEVSVVPGSSPHTRGALQPRMRTPGQSRIIPAYAGSTC